MVKAFTISNIIMHIIIIGIFIGIFFFTYGAYLEKKILKNQIKYMIDDSLDNLVLLYPNLSKSINTMQKNNILEPLQKTIDKASISSEYYLNDLNKTIDLNKTNLSKSINTTQKTIDTGFISSEYYLNDLNKTIDLNKTNLSKSINTTQKTNDTGFISSEYYLNSVNNISNKSNNTEKYVTDPINLTKNISNDLKKTIDDYIIKIKNLKYEPDKELDDAVTKSNKKVMIKSGIIFSSGLVIGLVIIFIITKILGLDGMTAKTFYMKLFKKNMIVLLFIAITEFLFAHFFVQHIMSIDVNIIKKSIIDNLIRIQKS